MEWKEYYINIAKAVALKSKDPSTKVGAVIVDKDNRVVSQGFNGFVKGCNEALMSLERPLNQCGLEYKGSQVYVDAYKEKANGV